MREHGRAPTRNKACKVTWTCVTVCVMTIEHGRLSSYTHGRCRCDACRQAFAAYRKARRSQVAGTEPPAHGIGGYTNWGCRCEVCSGAVAARSRDRRAS